MPISGTSQPIESYKVYKVIAKPDPIVTGDGAVSYESNSIYLVLDPSKRHFTMYMTDNEGNTLIPLKEAEPEDRIVTDLLRTAAVASPTWNA